MQMKSPPHYQMTSRCSNWLLGEMIPAFTNPTYFLYENMNTGADVIAFKMALQKGLQINHPDLVHHILVGNHKNYIKSKPYIRFESAIGAGLLTTNEDKWKRDRQKIQPMFNRERIMGYYFEVINEATEAYKSRLITKIEAGNHTINLSQEMAYITTEVILKSIFGRDVDNETIAALYDSYAVAIDYLKNIRVFPTIDSRRIFCTPSYFRFKKAVNHIDRCIVRLCEKYKDEVLSDKHNMLALLINAQKENPEHFTDQVIRDHATTMVFAGFESTSIMMQWFWYVLDEQKDLRSLLLEEIKAYCPEAAKRNSEKITYESINAMPILAAALKETMRLYPPFWMLGREALEEETIGTITIPKNVSIVLPQLAIHRHPQWWDKPNSFMYERFLPENEKNIHPGAYFPFSHGPRKCSGQAFVEMEAKIIVAKLLPCFSFAILNKVGNGFDPGISLKLKKPLLAKVTLN